MKIFVSIVIGTIIFLLRLHPDHWLRKRRKHNEFIESCSGWVYHIEIVDFIGGIFLYDFLGDDFATSRKLAYTNEQRILIKNFMKTILIAGKRGRADYMKLYPAIFPSETK